MRRGNRFLIALISAGITFGVLTASLGTDHWQRYHRYHHGYYHHDCHDDDGTLEDSQNPGI